MKQLLFTLLFLSLSGSLLCLILLLARQLTGRRLPRSFFYYAWLLVLLRLLLPVGLALPLPALTQTAGTELVQLPPSGAEAPPPSQGAQGSAGTAAPQPPTATLRPRSLSPTSALFLLWLLGALSSLGWHAVAYAAFLRRLRPSLCPPPPELLALFADLAPGKRVALACSPMADAPMLVGLLRPVVVLPPEGWAPGADQRMLRAALRHELTHHRRKDIAYKWLVVLVTSLHWFNPLVYWMRRQIALDCELSCDEAVLGTLEQDGRMAYGDLLLALAARRLPCRGAAAPLCQEKAQLKARLLGIRDYRRPTRAMACPAAALALLLLCCACGVLQPGAASPSPSPTSAGAVQEDPYAQILAQYAQALGQRQPEAEPQLPAALTSPYWAWQDEDSLLDRIGYARLDLNGDDVEELVLGWTGGEFWNLDEGYLFAIYTLVEGQPILAVEGWERSLYVLREDGLLAHCGSSGAGWTVWRKYRFDPEAEGFLETVEQVSVPEQGEAAIETGEEWMASGAAIPYALFSQQAVP